MRVKAGIDVPHELIHRILEPRVCRNAALGLSAYRRLRVERRALQHEVSAFNA